MAKNRLQVLYNFLEREFAASEAKFMAAEKLRFRLKEDYATLLQTAQMARERLTHYPQAQSLKRLGLIETLLAELLANYEKDRRHLNALGFLLSRLRQNLATEMLEPKLYEKIRQTLQHEESLKALREKYPDAEEIVTVPKAIPPQKPTKTVRLMLFSAARINYAIPVTRIVRRTPATSPLAAKFAQNGYREIELPVTAKRTGEHTQAIAYRDLKDERRLVFCNSYYKPLEIPQKMLKRVVTYAQSTVAGKALHRPMVHFYGRNFFVYGARLSYTVRTGGSATARKTHAP